MRAQKIPALVLAFALLCACAAPAGEHSPTPTGTEPADAVILTDAESAEQCAQVILNSQSDREDYAALSPEEVEFYLSEVYGIPEDCRDLAAVIYTAGGVDGREIAVLWGTDSARSYAAAAALEDYRRSRAGDFTGYAPKQAALVENGLVMKGNVALLVLCADPEAARKALKEELSYLVIEPFDPAEEPPEAYDWTEYLDEKGRIRFDPPNEYDMTPYDATAILVAWESGERDWLGEKDAAILARCEEILDECVTGDMTDFEKELAIHDWLIDNISYDQTAHDPQSHGGRPDNLNPYGALVNGYAICLGYATAFQLLMELAGVECITVVGAIHNSSSDHGWNMVKLDGEWYCVDVTWDDPTGADDLSSRVHHRYFNVTGDYLRETDHQWDYDNVPEATATRYRWDGTGEPPQ